MFIDRSLWKTLDRRLKGSLLASTARDGHVVFSLLRSRLLAATLMALQMPSLADQYDVIELSLKEGLPGNALHGDSDA